MASHCKRKLRIRKSLFMFLDIILKEFEKNTKSGTEYACFNLLMSISSKFSSYPLRTTLFSLVFGESSY